MRLISRILDALFPPRPTERLVRDASPDALAKILAPEPFVAGSIESTALLPYRAPLVHACVIEAKFHGNKKAQELLGIALAEYLLERIADDAALLKGTVLIPIPLSSARRKSRGYNQVEEVCRVARERLGDKVTLSPDALTRVRDTLPQTALGGEGRRKNLIGAFAAGADLDPAYLYIVVDDVVTTGATLHAGAVALQASHCSRILCVALAH